MMRLTSAILGLTFLAHAALANDSYTCSFNIERGTQFHTSKEQTTDRISDFSLSTDGKPKIFTLKNVKRTLEIKIENVTLLESEPETIKAKWKNLKTVILYLKEGKEIRELANATVTVGQPAFQIAAELETSLIHLYCLKP